MGFVSEFFDSGIWQDFLLPIIVFFIIIYVIFWLVFKKAPGLVIQEIMGNRPIKLDEIDAQVHPRIVDACKRTCKFSDDPNVRFLYIRSTDNVHFTHSGGMKLIGKVIGLANTQTAIMVMFKKRPWSFRKYFFISPPELLLSSSGARSIIFEGMAVRNLEGDFFYPIPSQKFKIWDENKMDWWAIHDFYETRRVQASTLMYTQVFETTGLLSASGSDTTRMFRDSVRAHQFRQEVPPVDDTTQEPGFVK